MQRLFRKKPICTEHKEANLSHLKPLWINLKNRKEAVYVWDATAAQGDGASSDYSKESQDTNKDNIIVSGCSTTSDKIIVLDSFATRKISCRRIFTGKVRADEQQ